MQLDHVLSGNSGTLLQVVDFLRYPRRRLAGAVETRKREVSAAGLRGRKMRIHGKTPPPGLVSHLLAGEELIERDRPVLGPQPARRAEVGDAALGRNAGAGEGNDDAGGTHHPPPAVGGGLPNPRLKTFIFL